MVLYVIALPKVGARRYITKLSGPDNLIAINKTNGTNRQ